MAGLSFFKSFRKVFGSLAIIIPVLALSGCGEGDGPTGIKNVAVPPLNLPAGFCDPINFEIECDSPGIIWFGGGQTIVVDNPDKSGINQSDSVGRMQKFGDQPFGGTRLNPVEVPIDLSAGESYKIKVWSERPVDVTFKLEQDALFEGGSAALVETHPGGSAWEELCFDFSTVDVTADVFGLTIIFDNGILGQAIGGIFEGDWTFYYDDITQVERCSDAPLTGIVPDVSLYDPAGTPQVPADIDVTAFDSQSVIDQVYAVDDTYMPVLAVSSGVGYGANIAQIGFTGGDRGFLSEFESLDFKVKGMPNNVIFVKLFDGVDSLRINLTSSAYADELTGGWYQVSIPVSAFNGVSLATGIVFESDNTAPMQFMMLLTDIGFTGGDDGGGGGVVTAGIFSETNTDPLFAQGALFNTVEFDGSNNTPSRTVAAGDLGNGVTAFDGTDVLEIDYQDTGGSYGGALFQFMDADISSYTTLKFSVNASQLPGFADVTIQFEPPAGPVNGNNVFLSDYDPVAESGDWSTYEIPLADFSSATLTAVDFLGFWNPRNAPVNGPLAYGQLYLDDVHLIGTCDGDCDGGDNGGDNGGGDGGDGGDGGTDPDAVVFDDNYGAGVSFAPFGGSVNDVTVDVTEMYSGSASLRVEVPAAGYTGGALVVNPGRDVSGYDTLTFWAKASVEPRSLNGAGIANDTSETVPNAYEVNGLALTTTWQQFTLTIPDPSLLTANTGLFHFAEGSDEGAYTIWFDDIIYEASGDGGSGSGDCVRGPGPELATNGDIEAGDLTCFDVFTDFGGVATADNTQNHTDGGTWSIHAVSNGNRASTVIKQSFLAPGTVVNGDTIDVSFWMKGTAAAGGVINPKVIAEGAGDAAVGFELVPNIPVPGADWTLHSYSQLVNADVTRGVTFEIAVVCADIAECTADVFIDDVSVTIQ